MWIAYHPATSKADLWEVVVYLGKSKHFRVHSQCWKFLDVHWPCVASTYAWPHAWPLIHKHIYIQIYIYIVGHTSGTSSSSLASGSLPRRGEFELTSD